MKFRVVFWRIFFVAYLLGVGYLCLHSFSSTPKLPFALWDIPSDKLVHMIMFMPFPVLAYLSYDKRSNSNLRAFLFVAAVFLLGGIVAALTEVCQSLTPDRSPDIKDFYADLVGLAITCIPVLLVDVIRNSRSSKSE